MSKTSTEQNSRVVKVILANTFRDSLKGTQLENEDKLNELMSLLANNPFQGHSSKFHNNIYTIEFAGRRVFYLPTIDEIYLLMTDDTGPEQVPSQKEKSAIANLMGKFGSSLIQQVINLIHQK